MQHISNPGCGFQSTFYTTIVYCVINEKKKSSISLIIKIYINENTKIFSSVKAVEYLKMRISVQPKK